MFPGYWLRISSFKVHVTPVAVKRARSAVFEIPLEYIHCYIVSSVVVSNKARMTMHGLMDSKLPALGYCRASSDHYVSRYSRPQ